MWESNVVKRNQAETVVVRVRMLANKSTFGRSPIQSPERFLLAGRPTPVEM